MNYSFKKLLFNLGVKFRNPTLKQSLQYLENSEDWSLEKLNCEQEKRLKLFFRHVYRTREVYRDHWGNEGKELYKNWSLDQFENLKACDKRFLIQENTRIQGDAHKLGKVFFSETSGTSGQILTFYKGEEWDSFNRAFNFRALSWHGVEPWEPSLYFWGYNMSFWKKLKSKTLDFLVNRYRVFNYDSGTIAAIKKKLDKVALIEGYSSVIYELSKVSSSNKKPPKNLKLIKGTSEKIFEHYHQASIKSFGTRITSEYGAAESGIIATECKFGNMHINVLGVYVEVDDNGEIIVTNLVSHSFPIVRYRLGDVVKLSNRKCLCGLNHPILEEVTGRVGKNIYGFHGKYASLTLYYIFKNLYFNYNVAIDYQAHQWVRGELEIWIKDSISNEVLKFIYKECKNYFKRDMRISVKFVTDLRQNNGKLRDFISYIDS